MIETFSPSRRATRVPSFVISAALLALPAAAAAAQTDADVPRRTSNAQVDPPMDPVIAEALAAVPAEVRRFNDHLTILASPWMEGRLPGTRGMELSKEYMEYYFKEAGLKGPYASEVENADGTLAVQTGGSYRQPFRLGSDAKVESVSLSIKGEGAGAMKHGRDDDYTLTGMGTGGDVSAPAVFVGYAIADGKDGFTSFDDDYDLTGKVAVMLRFEPMNDEGWSKWRDRRGWSSRAGFANKLQAVAERGAVAAVIVNTPGTADTRANSIMPAGGSSEAIVDIPVVHMSTDAGGRLVGGEALLMEMRKLADNEPLAVELPGTFELSGKMKREARVAENIVAVLPGKGRLADEYIVVGAHLDHLGMGEFGSRDSGANRGGKLHPGADDNASGSAGILLIAEKLAKDYADLPDDVPARSVVFIGFSAEESGLHGSRYYAANPIGPIEKHVLMMNFDMIGRIANRRLSLSGTNTGVGMQSFLAPILEASPLEIVEKGGASGGSDHQMFYAKEVPVLFAILADFHEDYHTSRDTSNLINRVDAVHAANLFYEIARETSTLPEAFAFQRPPRRQAAAEPAPRAAPRAVSRVRLGIRLTGDGGKVTIAGVTSGTTAAEAGMREGDVLVGWNGETITDGASLSAMLVAAKPGDTVVMKVQRDGRAVELPKVALQPARATGRAAATQRQANEAPAPSAQGGSPSASPRAASKVQFGIQPSYEPSGKGVVASTVTEGSPAEAAGLKAGDRILTWDGEEIAGARGLGTLLGAADPGDEIEVTVERDGKTMTKKVTLKARGNGS